MSLWQAPEEIRKLVEEIRDDNHHPIGSASFWVLVSDGKGLRDNRIQITQSRKCTSSEKLATGHDFKIIVVAETWANLTDAQRRTALDEALCRCGVQYVPEMVEVNGKKIPLKDEQGRIIYTNEIAYDREGNPRWKINRPDAEVFFSMILRHKRYNEEIDNTLRILEGKPIKSPSAAERKDKIRGMMEAGV